MVGRATSGSGEAYGVVGETNSDDRDAMAILAKAQNTNAIEADARGGPGNGLRAYSDSSFYSIYAAHQGTGGDGAPAIWASNRVANEPAVEAVANRFGSDPGVGVKSEGHINSTHNVTADGHVQASKGFRGNVGSSAYLSSFASIDGTKSKIPFDETVVDQRGEFDTGNHWFECAHDGAYEVSFGLESAGTFGSLTSVEVELKITSGNASDNPAGAQGITYDFKVPGSGSGSGTFGRTFSRTVYGLLAGNRLSVEISQDSGSSKDLTSGEEETFFEVRQVA